MKHAPTRKLSDALFRGRDSEYSFKVYPLTAHITDQPAVFIISRRIVDKFGRGHHLTICIGETDSTLKELRKHRRAMCVKQNAANVVCLLKEKENRSRRFVIRDLVASRTFSCVSNVYKPKIEPVKKSRRKPSRTSNAKTAPGNSSVKSRGAATRAAASKTGSRVSGSVDRNG